MSGDRPIVKLKQWLNLLLFLLVAGIAGQTALAVNRAWQASTPPAPGSAIVIGDSLPTLAGSLEGGIPTTMRLATDTGAVTVLYVFHPSCVHCHAVAPMWADHFSADNQPVVRRVAVTNDVVESGVAYAERFGWEVEVLSVQDMKPGSREHSLLSRTPWVFVFDSVGVLRYQGHGSRLDQMMRAISTI